jgi:hypothetical protein
MNEYMTSDRNADRLMEDPVISQFTFAWFKDTGWYQVDDRYATEMLWGKGKGCEFITSNLCYNDPDTSHVEFCEVEDARACGYTKTFKGTCVSDYSAENCLVTHAVSDQLNRNGDCRNS